MALIHHATPREKGAIKIREVSSRDAADLLVCVVAERAAAEQDGVWCYVDSAKVATSQICTVDSGKSADLLIFFVSSRAAAGWQRAHPLQGKL